LLLGGLTRPGRSRTKQADMRIFSKKAATARSSRSGGSRDRAGRGEGIAFKTTAFETSQWLPWQKPDTTWAWKLIRLDVGLQHSLALLTADGGSSASSAREWEKNWLDQAVAALNSRTLRHAAHGGARMRFAWRPCRVGVSTRPSGHGARPAGDRRCLAASRARPGSGLSRWSSSRVRQAARAGASPLR
jgi:hypothetical protein